MSLTFSNKFRRILAAVAACGIVATLAGCANPQTPQASDSTVNVLATADMAIPANTIKQIAHDTGLKLSIKTVPVDSVESALAKAKPGAVDVVLGADLIDLGNIQNKVLSYNAIGSGKGSADFAPAFGSEGTAISFTAICADYKSGATAPKNLSSFIGDEYSHSVTASRSNAFRAWKTGITNGMGEHWWQKFEPNLLPVGSRSASPYQISQVSAFTPSTRAPIPGSCVRWVRYASVIRAGSRINNAMRLIDELISLDVQRQLALATDTFPVTRGTKMPKPTTDLNKMMLIPINDQDTAGSLQGD